MTDDEIRAVYNRYPYTEQRIDFARAIIAAYQDKLLAGVEMPEPIDEVVVTVLGRVDCVTAASAYYTADQLQQYAAACAAQAREKALDEAKRVCLSLFDLEDDSCNEAEQCAAAIELLKRGE